jgi:hypothetical protein
MPEPWEHHPLAHLNGRPFKIEDTSISELRIFLHQEAKVTALDCRDFAFEEGLLQAPYSPTKPTHYYSGKQEERGSQIMAMGDTLIPGISHVKNTSLVPLHSAPHEPRVTESVLPVRTVPNILHNQVSTRL